MAPNAPLRDGKSIAVAAEIGTSLLEIAELNNQPIEAGCRMGVCGADPVAVLGGASCLTSPGQDELNTLRRLGFGKSTRMACCARIESGTVTVSLTPEPGDGQIHDVIAAVADAGGLDYARERALGLAEQADRELDRLAPGPARDALRASITYVVDRRR